MFIAAMTCVENGISMKEVDMETIWKGYDLSWPVRRVMEVVDEEIIELEDISVWDVYWVVVVGFVCRNKKSGPFGPLFL